MKKLKPAVLEHFRSVLGPSLSLLSYDGFDIALFRDPGTRFMVNATVGLCDSPARCELMIVSRDAHVPMASNIVEALGAKQDLRRGQVVPLEAPLGKNMTPTALYLAYPHRHEGLQSGGPRVDVHWVIPIMAEEQGLAAEALDRLAARRSINFTNFKRAAVTKR